MALLAVMFRLSGVVCVVNLAAAQQPGQQGLAQPPGTQDADLAVHVCSL